MYHSVIGRRLVLLLNQRDGKSRTVREFFEGEYVPLFFGSSRLLQNVNNSPFDQTFTKQKKRYSADLLQTCLRAVNEKVSSCVPDASFFLGGPAAGNAETTSGQVTNLAVPVTEEDVYSSWIGAALGLTVQGGITLLIESDEVILETYSGWTEYRKYLEQTPSIKPLQINTWNCQRLVSGFNDEIRFDAVTDKLVSKLETQRWVTLLFALARRLAARGTTELTAYAYSLGQSNTTIGFVQISLRPCRLIAEIYRKLFTVPSGMTPASFVNLYDTADSFYDAASHAQIGLRALRPKDVFGAAKAVPNVPKPTESERQISFDIYQTWIIAMLNKEQLYTLAEQLAVALFDHQKSQKRLKNSDNQAVKTLLEKKSAREFIDSLTEIVISGNSNLTLYEEVVKELIELPPDKVPLFLTLLRFRYAAVTQTNAN